MFRPNWSSSGVQIVVVKDSAANCDTVTFPPIIIASGYFGYVGYHQCYLGVLGFHVDAFGYTSIWYAGYGCPECSC
jgi:hypothetical protein